VSTSHLCLILTCVYFSLVSTSHTSSKSKHYKNLCTYMKFKYNRFSNNLIIHLLTFMQLLIGEFKCCYKTFNCFNQGLLELHFPSVLYRRTSKPVACFWWFKILFLPVISEKALSSVMNLLLDIPFQEWSWNPFLNERK